MTVRHFAEMTWEELRDLPKERAIVILPVGAVEAHGPHLPLETDVIIAQAMAVAGSSRLAATGWTPVILPALPFTAAPFAEGFSGTVSVAAETVTRLVIDIADSLARHGFRWWAIANAHLDPAHVGALQRAVDETRDRGAIGTIFPDLTRKPWASRLTDEFQSGACHAGQYETSIVMAARPDLVRERARAALPDNPTSLSQAIRAGQKTFEEAGGTSAYFGYPAAATTEEGHATIETLGEILAEAVERDAS